jgi:hypothetical protein
MKNFKKTEITMKKHVVHISLVLATLCVTPSIIAFTPGQAGNISQLIADIKAGRVTGDAARARAKEVSLRMAPGSAILNELTDVAENKGISDILERNPVEEKESSSAKASNFAEASSDKPANPAYVKDSGGQGKPPTPVVVPEKTVPGISLKREIAIKDFADDIGEEYRKSQKSDYDFKAGRIEYDGLVEEGDSVIPVINTKETHLQGLKLLHPNAVKQLEEIGKKIENAEKKAAQLAKEKEEEEKSKIIIKTRIKTFAEEIKIAYDFAMLPGYDNIKKIQTDYTKTMEKAAQLIPGSKETYLLGLERLYFDSVTQLDRIRKKIKDAELAPQLAKEAEEDKQWLADLNKASSSAKASADKAAAEKEAMFKKAEALATEAEKKPVVPTKGAATQVEMDALIQKIAVVALKAETENMKLEDAQKAFSEITNNSNITQILNQNKPQFVDAKNNYKKIMNYIAHKKEEAKNPDIRIKKEIGEFVYKIGLYFEASQDTEAKIDTTKMLYDELIAKGATTIPGSKSTSNPTGKTYMYALTTDGTEETKAALKQLETMRKQLTDTKKLPATAVASAQKEKQPAAEKAKPTTLPQAGLTFDELVQRSNAFEQKVEIPFPTKENRIAIIAGNDTGIQDIITTQANTTYPIMHNKVEKLITSFLTYKKKSGSDIEKQLYATMDRNTFIDRLLIKRPLSFVGAKNVATSIVEERCTLRDGVKYSGNNNSQFEAIGTEREMAPRTLAQYLSYDEMQISALMGVSVPTFFINDGDRGNRGEKIYKAHPSQWGCLKIDEEDARPYEKTGVYIGIVGARFERPNLMEWQHIMITAEQNTTAHGYGLNVTYAPGSPLDFWSKTYGGIQFPTFEEAVANTSGKYPKLGDNYFNKEAYKERIKLVIEPFLLDAQSRGELSKKSVYVHAVGLGLGAWEVKGAPQAQLMLDAYAEIINENNLSKITDIDFSWFPENLNCGGSIDGDVFSANKNNIKIHFSKRNTAALLEGNNTGKLLVAMYAWDGNSYPGNEYWDNMLCASGDPAAACCSTIAELQNPEINKENVSGKKMKVRGGE